MSTSAIRSDELPSTSYLLELVKSHFSSEWSRTTTHEIQIRRISGGFVNRLTLLTRSTPAVHEPACVLVRFFGTKGGLQDPPESNTTLSAIEQAIVYHEMGRRGLGPKLYGVFRGGRLEEWIDAHTLTPEESKDPSIRRDVARSYARLHCLHLPLRNGGLQLLTKELEGVGQQADEFAQVLLLNDDGRVREFADILKRTNWTNELEWAKGLIRKYQCKAAFVIGDANHLNVLVKNYTSECQVMLIDYETLHHGFRGFDIGGHFNERMYCYSSQDDVVSGHPAPDLQEQLLFCEAYLQEMRDLGLDLDKLDTVGHLLIESKIGRLFHILFSVLMCFNGEIIQKPGLLAGLTHMMKIYHQLKVDFNQPSS